MRGISRRFSTASGDELLALDHVSFDVHDGEFVCVVGPSGCGKSTVLNILSGLDSAFDGHWEISDEGSSSVDERPRVAYVFQEPRLLPWLSVRANIAFAMKVSSVKRDSSPSPDELIDLVGLNGFENHYPHQLSGGMQQRAAIARALSVDPAVLLMDEPFSGLDEITARQMRHELLRIWTETKKTVLFVTHNCFEASFLADRILFMRPRPGRIERSFDVNLPRPRQYEDHAVFDMSRKVISAFLTLTETDATGAGHHDRQEGTRER